LHIQGFASAPLVVSCFGARGPDLCAGFCGLWLIMQLDMLLISVGMKIFPSSKNRQVYLKRQLKKRKSVSRKSVS
jgi:hypothetical protein